MLKKTVTYEDFNGESVTEDLYFNLSKAELIELELSEKGGLGAYLEKLAQSDDGAEIVGTFKKLLLASFGVKSDDGRRFIKNDKLREEFEQSGAYPELFMELATNTDAAIKFVNGLMPKDLTDEVAKIVEERGVENVSAPVLESQEEPGETVTEITEKDVREMSREELIEAYKQNIQNKASDSI